MGLRVLQSRYFVFTSFALFLSGFVFTISEDERNKALPQKKGGEVEVSINYANQKSLVIGIEESSLLPLDDEEAEMVRLISQYRRDQKLGPIRPSVALTMSSDELSRELATRRIALGAASIIHFAPHGILEAPDNRSLAMVSACDSSIQIRFPDEAFSAKGTSTQALFLAQQMAVEVARRKALISSERYFMATQCMAQGLAETLSSDNRLSEDRRKELEVKYAIPSDSVSETDRQADIKIEEAFRRGYQQGRNDEHSFASQSAANAGGDWKLWIGILGTTIGAVGTLTGLYFSKRKDNREEQKEEREQGDAIEIRPHNIKKLILDNSKVSRDEVTCLLKRFDEGIDTASTIDSKTWVRKEGTRLVIPLEIFDDLPRPKIK